MFSDNHLINIILHCFYNVFGYYLSLKIQLNWYKILLILWLFLHNVLSFRVSKISFNIFVQSFFCWLLNFVYRIYRINIHWSWNVSLGVIENCQWAISKPYIRIFFPCRFVEGCGKGARFSSFTCGHQYIDWLQCSYSSLKFVDEFLAIDL